MERASGSPPARQSRRRGLPPGITKTSRKKNPYKARYPLPKDPKTGKRREPTKYFATPEAASAWRTARMNELYTGVVIDAGTFTVESWMQEWLRTGKSRKGEPLAPGTIKDRRSVFEKWVKGTAFGSTRLRDLTSRHVKVFYESLPGLTSTPDDDGFPTSGSRTQTILHRVHRTVSAALTWAVVEELIATNPASRGHLNQPYIPPRDEVRFWQRKEVRSFLDHVQRMEPVGWSKHHPSAFNGFYPACNLGFATGMRLMELLELGWEDVNLGGGTIRVRSDRARGKRLKTKQSHRPVKLLDEREIAVLRDWQRTRTVQPLRGRGSGLVFTYEDGRPVSAGAFEGWFNDAVAAAQVTRLTPIGWRHTHAVALLSAGWDIYKVAKRLGNSVKVIESTYGDLFADKSAGGKSFTEVVYDDEGGEGVF